MPEKERPFLPYPIIAGPTAGGKTALAVALARRIGGEVVSADSMQIYAGISVGTACPTPEERQGVPHHLQGFLPLEEKYSVARYLEDADRVFREIFARGRTPVLCGGTGLYIQSFMENRRFTPQQGDPVLRERLTERGKKEGGAILLTELAQVDPETAARLHENDLHRIVRALEVYETTGRTISEQARCSLSVPSPYDGCLFVLTYRDRQTLYRRIDQRVDAMLENGLLAEARLVLQSAPDATVLQAIGYKELLPYFSGEISLEEAAARLKIGTRHYAKRQLSWFRRMPQARLLYADDYPDGEALLTAVLEQYHEFAGGESHGR